MRYSYKNGLSMLVSWAKKEGYKLVETGYTDTSYIDWVKTSETLNTPKEIKIEGGFTYELTTYILLHELGHHQLRKDWNKFNTVLPMAAYAEHKYYKKKDTKYTRRVSYVVSSLEEEFKAWEEGYKLGKKLGIKIDDKKWNRFKTKCLMSYIRYYSTLRA